MSVDPMPAIKDILGWPQESVGHVRDAVKLIADADDVMDDYRGNSDPNGEALVAATQALTHATLALVEQQRIGNIIAWEQVTGEKNRALIRDGLGLS